MYLDITYVMMVLVESSSSLRNQQTFISF